MDLVRAFSFPFDDNRWLQKLAILAVIAVVTFLLTPLVVGLLGWAALIGYQVEIVRRWRAGKPVPLPTWDNFGRLMNSGFYPLVALLLYQIPNGIVGATFLLLNQNLGAGVVSGVLLFFLTCCMLPIVLIYNAITLPMLALGMGRYVDEPRLGVFLEIGYLLVTLRDNLGLATLYLVFTAIANAIFTIVGTVTFGIVPAVLGVLVLGALNGQLAAAILGMPKSPSPLRPSSGRS
ncbi:MAG: DUF4013 domain-containing protein [Chloroflexota bacterium]|nr:DUF4013 domain-containing protein [Chloroflexota bacterium]